MRKSPSTRASKFVREEIHHIRGGKHGARSTQQAIAIGLSKARRAGVRLPKPSSSASTSPSSSRQKGRFSPTRSRAISGVLRREPRRAASGRNLSRQARQSAIKRGASARKRAAMRALRTKGRAGLRQAARKAARTRRAG